MFPFRPEEAFEVNLDLEIEILTIEGTTNQVVVADNFYKKPDMVRQIILNSPYPIWKDQPDTKNFTDYYDCRQSIYLPYEGAQNVVQQIAKQFLGITQHTPEPIFNSNVFRLITEQPENSQPFPHDDGNLIAALVMLNTEEECSGGTGFYRSKSPQADRMPADPDNHKALHEQIFTDSNYELGTDYFMQDYENYWDLLGIIPMKYNRLLVYPGIFFHGAWHEDDAFKDCYRINQAMFLKDVTYDMNFWGT